MDPRRRCVETEWLVTCETLNTSIVLKMFLNSSLFNNVLIF